MPWDILRVAPHEGIAIATLTAPLSHPPIGALLREWRAARRLSQLELALETGISTRHLSCVETGKARASRDTVSRLADALGMPLRERNALLRAAGFAAMHSERSLAAPALERVRPSVEMMLAGRDPRDVGALARDAVRANVRASANHLRHGSELLEQLIRTDGLLVVGAEYSLETGVVTFFDGVPEDID